MNAILGFSQMLMKQAQQKPDPKTLSMVERIFQNGRHLLTMVEDMLSFSRLRANSVELSPEQFELQGLIMITTTLEELRPLAEQKALSLQTELPSDPITVVNDRGRLRQIITNLVSNAFKFTDVGGVVVSLRSLPQNRLQINVRDTGCGINAKDQPYVFQEFWQVHSARPQSPGPGLGLAITHALVQAMGGNITVQSELGRGSTFRVEPPNYHLLIHSDRLELSRGPRENGHRPAIDPMFRSAAKAHGPTVVGVVLTGMLDDGTAGLKSIKAEGGVALVQDPEEAMFKGMPSSAIASVEVDAVLPLHDLADKIVADLDEEALTEARHVTYSQQAVDGLSEAQIEQFFEHKEELYTFRKDLRRSVIFGRHDLLQDAPISEIDLLLWRNTLMYFNAEVQSKILARFHFALQDHGFLFLGKAEMLLTHSNLFTPAQLTGRIFKKLPRPTMRDRLLTMAQSGNEDAAENLADQLRLREAAFDLSPVARMVLERNGVIALVNQRAKVLFGLSQRDVILVMEEQAS